MDDATQRDPRVWAVVAAAGSGTRFGGDFPKQFSVLGGSTLLERTLGALRRCSMLGGLVVVLPADRLDAVAPDPRGSPPVRVVAGGPRRSDSVRAGLGGLPDECELVLIHDGVRPSVTPALVERIVALAWREGACVPVLPVVETVKEMGAGGHVARTLDRERLGLAQTPQGFRRQVIQDAYRWAEQSPGREFTDDAALVEASGGRVATVEGDPGNLKVTRPADLVRLGWLVPRVGYGYDVHRLAPGRKLILGGIEIPFERGLDGHSDADVALHALCDAVLGAAAMGDIGLLFPDDDPAWKGASSLDLLREVCARVERQGWRVHSVDVTVVAQAPRLSPHLPAMAGAVSSALGLEPGAVGLKATTEEGLGFTGTGEGMAAHAVAVLVPRSEGLA